MRKCSKMIYLVAQILVLMDLGGSILHKLNKKKSKVTSTKEKVSNHIDMILEKLWKESKNLAFLCGIKVKKLWREFQLIKIGLLVMFLLPTKKELKLFFMLMKWLILDMDCCSVSIGK